MTDPVAGGMVICRDGMAALFCEVSIPDERMRCNTASQMWTIVVL